MRTPMVRDCWRALWISRALVWASGVAGLLLLGRSARWPGFDPGRLTVPFGAVGDALVAPAARWDSVWYLSIAGGGYREEAQTAFFPLYPGLVGLLGAPLGVLAGPQGGRLLAGIAISLVAMFAGLCLVHRLAELELGGGPARLTVLLVALFPTAFVLSAVYTESLFLALSAGTLYAGRRGRWAWAGALGALAAATRSTGALLVVPLALLYLLGPRGDAVRERDRDGRRRLHRVRPDAAFLLAVPAGTGAYLAFLAVATGDALDPFQVGDLWYREFAGPLGGVWDGAVAAWAGARQLLSGSREPAYFAPAGGDPFDVAAHNAANFAFLAFAAVAVVGTLRRLPVAYGAWVLVALALPLSYPTGPEPLASIPRYLVVLFPLHMWLAAWSLEHRRVRPVLGVCAVTLALLSAQFAAWEWVG